MKRLLSGQMALKPVLTYGEPLVVCVHQGGGSLAANRAFQVDSAGAELNTAVALARLNIPVAYAAAIGDDPFGEFLMRELRGEGVDVTRVASVAQGSTGVLFKMRAGLSKEPQVFYYRSVSPMGSNQWDADTVIRDVRAHTFSWVHTTGIACMLSERTREQAITMMRTAYEQGIPTSFDVNIRLKMADIEDWRMTLQEVMPYTTWLFMGDTEAALLFATQDLDDLKRMLRERSFRGRGLIVKKGEKGAAALVGDTLTHVDAWPVEQVVDTVGAGDGFNAGWIAGTLLGWDMERALKLGAIVGAYAVTSAGDASGYPNWQTALGHLDGFEEVTR